MHSINQELELKRNGGVATESRIGITCLREIGRGRTFLEAFSTSFLTNMADQSKSTKAKTTETVLDRWLAPAAGRAAAVCLGIRREWIDEREPREKPTEAGRVRERRESSDRGGREGRSLCVWRTVKD